MNLTPELCHTFVDVGFFEGLRMLCAERAELADKILRTADPLDSTKIAKAQAAYAIYTQDLPSIEREVKEFLKTRETPQRQA